MYKINYKNNSKGFTIVEIIIVVFIFSLISVAVWKFQYDVINLNNFFTQSLANQEEARKALEIMSAEIRSASQSSLGTYPLLQTSSSSIIFYSNLDSDSLVEKIHYFLDGNILKKGVTKPSGNPVIYDSDDEVVIDFVQNISNSNVSIFNYYDSNYSGTESPLEEPFDISSVRLVEVELIIGVDQGMSSRNFILSTQVSLRNIKDNI